MGRVLWLRERRPSKTPIEIITAPTPPVYDNSPATPTNRPVVERPGRDGSANEQSANAIPRNASERKRYQPKLVGSATPSSQSDEERVAETNPAPSKSTGTPVNRVPAATPTPTVTTAITPDKTNPGETVEVPIAAPRDAGSPQRTIIVRSEGEAVRERTTPARQVPGTFPETPDPTGGTASTTTKRPATSSQPEKQPQQPPVEREPLPRNQTVKIPPLPPMTTADPATAEPSKARTMKHTIEAGQTYYSLSRYYGVTVDDLLTANNLTLDDKLAVGQKLTIPNVPAGYPMGSLPRRHPQPAQPGQRLLHRPR